MEHILPLASRRRPASISDAVQDPLVRDLLQHYRPALREIFRFNHGVRAFYSVRLYRALNVRRRESRVSGERRCLGPKSGHFLPDLRRSD